MFKTNIGAIFLSLSLAFLSQQTFAADATDYYLHAQGGVDLSSKTLSGGFIYGYYPWDEFGLGFSYDQSKSYSALGIDTRWSIEPFEVYMIFNEAFWSEKGGHWYTMFQLGTNYLFALSPSLSAYLQIKGIFPEQRTRSLLLGLGIRSLF